MNEEKLLEEVKLFVFGQSGDTEQDPLIRLAIQDLTSRLADELATKYLWEIQLREARSLNESLQARVNELEALLDERTRPAETDKGGQA